MKLHRAFRLLARSTLLGAVASAYSASAGCAAVVELSGQNDSGVLDAGGGDSSLDAGAGVSLCNPEYLALTDLGLSKTYDGIALYYGSTISTSPGDVIGTLCAKATSDACKAAIADGTKNGEGWGNGGFVPQALVATAGDEVIVANSPQELLAFLAPIRTPHAAALAMRPFGYSPYCDTAKAVVTASYIDIVLRRGTSCGEGDDLVEDTVRVNPDGTYVVVASTLIRKGDPNCAIGRRFAEMSSAGSVVRESGEPLGDFLSQIAYLEAAAVSAFARLEQELSAHNAPESLLRRVRLARRDEVRHASTMRKLAEKHGGIVPTVDAPLRPLPSLELIATENRVEGCLRETYGAAVAAFQAERATDPRLRAALARIAEDEAAHAELSWDIDQWAKSRLDHGARRRLDAAYSAAIPTLAQDIAVNYGRDIHELAGMPTAHEALALLDGVMGILAAA